MWQKKFDKKEFCEAYSWNSEIIYHMDIQQQSKYRILERFLAEHLTNFTFWSSKRHINSSHLVLGTPKDT
jgi:hypothetical protein